jgi:hypothetical protein
VNPPLPRIAPATVIFDSINLDPSEEFQELTFLVNSLPAPSSLTSPRGLSRLISRLAELSAFSGPLNDLVQNDVVGVGVILAIRRLTPDKPEPVMVEGALAARSAIGICDDVIPATLRATVRPCHPKGSGCRRETPRLGSGQSVNGTSNG